MTLVLEWDMKSKELYKITIKDGEVYTDLSEEDFMDKMVELSQCYYEVGYPHPDSISHETYGNNVHESNRDSYSNSSKEDQTG